MTNIHQGGTGAKALFKPDDLSLIPRNLMAEGDISKLYYPLHKRALNMHTHPIPREMKNVVFLNFRKKTNFKSLIFNQ